MLKWVCYLLLASAPLFAETPPSADEIISRVVARDKQLVQRRKAFDYDVEITREKLDSNRAVISTIRDHLVVVGDRRPGYGTRPATRKSGAGGPKDFARGAVRVAENHRPLHLHAGGRGNGGWGRLLQNRFHPEARHALRQPRGEGAQQRFRPYLGLQTGLFPDQK